VRPRIYYLHPWLTESPEDWAGMARHARDLGFTHLLLGWPFGSPDDLFLTMSLDTIAGRPTGQHLAALAGHCHDLGLKLWLDLAIAGASAQGGMAAAHPRLWAKPERLFLDPRTIDRLDLLVPALHEPAATGAFVELWAGELARWRAAGVSGVRCHEASKIPLAVWADILEPARRASPAFRALAWMPEATQAQKREAGRVFDYVPSSVAWWDGGEAWLAEEYQLVGAGSRLIGFPEDPFAARLRPGAPIVPLRERQLACASAALFADGWLLPMGYEYGMEAPFGHARAEDFRAASAGVGLLDAVRETNRQAALLPDGEQRSLRMLCATSAGATALRSSGGAHGHLVILNRDSENELPARVAQDAARLGLVPEPSNEIQPVPPASGIVVALGTAAPILTRPAADAPFDAGEWARLAIENVQPSVEGGRFAAKRSVGEPCVVTADIICDGHDMLAAELLWRPADASDWSRVPMRLLGNDRWQGEFPLLWVGRHEFAIEAWWAEFGTYRRDLVKKRDAGLDIALELREGQLILRKFAAVAAPGDLRVIEEHLARLGASQDEDAAVLTADALAEAMANADPRPHAVGADCRFPVEADREAAAFSGWYELFPRSITDDPARHGTFRDVVGRLPAIAAMGFDVLYFPPIHPIGKTNRKGRNNTLTPGPHDPGSPYAIGSGDGGHDAIHPELGSAEDFALLVREARRQGLEIALDFAIQCSPDHPWLGEHPGWFSWRPDGSMRYAENPPKKYQDIVNVDFYAADAVPGLWLALRDVVQSWVDRGVRIFRVDNPHTKPFPFWEWLIADIRSRDPGVLFLAEAFTRPKVMYRLGKVGFSQSYTYFTWRNTKAELTEYLTELNEAPARDIFRPHFFVNTPDINPTFLHHSGRPGFLIRAALAATLSGLWGVYSGFELCEASALGGKEEYLDSEKYEIKPRDWTAPGNIIAEITQLNRIRRSHRALQSHLGLSFYNASDDNIIYYGKRAEGDPDLILVAVNLDPHQTHSAAIEVPLWEFGLPDDASIEVEDLMRGHRFTWHGKVQTITLEPGNQPFAIWRLRGTAARRS
jgi:starch synthase (maltosyl-transferring)